MQQECMNMSMDHGRMPYVFSVERAAVRNRNFRTAVWTGDNLQMTLMSIVPCGEIGLEIHTETDQYLRIEQGNGVVQMGRCRQQLDFRKNVCRGDAIFVPAGTWHNLTNTGRGNLLVSSVYAPPNHPRGTIHRTKEEADLLEA